MRPGTPRLPGHARWEPAPAGTPTSSLGQPGPVSRARTAVAAQPLSASGLPAYLRQVLAGWLAPWAAGHLSPHRQLQGPLISSPGPPPAACWATGARPGPQDLCGRLAAPALALGHTPRVYSGQQAPSRARATDERVITGTRRPGPALHPPPGGAEGTRAPSSAPVGGRKPTLCQVAAHGLIFRPREIVSPSAARAVGKGHTRWRRLRRGRALPCQGAAERKEQELQRPHTQPLRPWAPDRPIHPPLAGGQAGARGTGLQEGQCAWATILPPCPAAPGGMPCSRPRWKAANWPRARAGAAQGREGPQEAASGGRRVAPVTGAAHGGEPRRPPTTPETSPAAAGGRGGTGRLGQRRQWARAGSLSQDPWTGHRPGPLQKWAKSGRRAQLAPALVPQTQHRAGMEAGGHTAAWHGNDQAEATLRG